MPERVVLRGTWRLGLYGGTLVFTGGPRDDYLELRADGQDLPEALKEVDIYLPGNVSLKSFADGRGLGILRTSAQDERRACALCGNPEC